MRRSVKPFQLFWGGHVCGSRRRTVRCAVFLAALAAGSAGFVSPPSGSTAPGEDAARETAISIAHLFASPAEAGERKKKRRQRGETTLDDVARQLGNGGDGNTTDHSTSPVTAPPVSADNTPGPVSVPAVQSPEKAQNSSTESASDSGNGNRRREGDSGRENRGNRNRDGGQGNGESDQGAVEQGPAKTVVEFWNRITTPEPAGPPVTEPGATPAAPAPGSSSQSPATTAAAASAGNASPPSRGDEASKPEESVAGATEGSAAQKETAGTKPAAAAKPRVALRKKKNGLNRWNKRDYGVFDPVRIPRAGILAVNPSHQTIDRALAKGFKVEEKTAMIGLGSTVTRLSPPPGMDLSEAEAFLRGVAPGEAIGINHKYSLYRPSAANQDTDTTPPIRAETEPCDGDHCFGREIMGWQKSLQTCARNMTVGVIDTAVDTAHPAFKTAVEKKRLVVENLSTLPARPGEAQHATGVVALMAGNSDSSTPGLIPDAKFFVADVFYSDGNGQLASDTMSLMRAFAWLQDKKARIINMSLSGPPDGLIRAEIERMSAAGVLFVAAAGNGGPGTPPSYPAAYDPVIAVTAISRDFTTYRYANQGDYIDVAAPGVKVWTAAPGGLSGYQSGTSFAVPYATSVLAVVYGSLEEKSKAAAMRALPVVDLGPAGRDEMFGDGLLMAPDSCGPGQTADARRDHEKTGTLMQSGVGAVEILPWAPAAGQR